MNGDIVIKSSCSFIELGIEKLLGDLIKERGSELITYYGADDQIKSILVGKLLFITFLCKDYTNDFILKLIEENTRRLQYDCKVILLTDFTHQDRLKRCIMSLYDSCLVLDVSLSINELKDKLSSFLLKENNVGYSKKITNKLKLSQREIIVLYYLLKGQKLSYVAERLGINYKTASGYKCSGMNKFGLRSLHTFMVPRNRVGTFNDDS
ncbi:MULTISPECIES: LuxR C-terminal-related transcriptional regulator [unclassified Serratia (in: enterobacteria)]|uniref:helix-turn-helix transcriptional regulator n=1 Tax=unclassified Serratia (in: enterobacteria) TaxID=2647522 RepID=UPI0005034D26|nr:MULTISPECIES: LuxR C-terminal-related transcriptional regulator [unclassified Serratia (in: enterobacteria)]KFK93699.1 hypothetical protein JV45_14905 [Serratia sp. Ag2]KFK98936.1 hypothetical protein IV04_09965 [Serratia sp. Ag1]